MKTVLLSARDYIRSITPEAAAKLKPEWEGRALIAYTLDGIRYEPVE